MGSSGAATGESAMAQHQRVLDINVLGVVRVTKGVLPLMRPRAVAGSSTGSRSAGSHSSRSCPPALRPSTPSRGIPSPSTARSASTVSPRGDSGAVRPVRLLRCRWRSGPSDARPDFEEGAPASGIVRPAVGVQDVPGGEFEISKPQFPDDLRLERGEMVGFGEGLADAPGCHALWRGHLIDSGEDLPCQSGPPPARACSTSVLIGAGSR
ncbi:hypothetical protein ABZ434_08805 [Streptomyces sp. NPDC005761]|uniref:hypothetical protein n=1 Tax=unclassified Streptomyces TaxID=2593676 RepID=UPI0033C26017